MPLKVNTESVKKGKKIICCECAKNIASIQSNCRKHDETHMFCCECAQKTYNRSAVNNWYKQYNMWCDTCIWFDIG